jgi:two-component system response regulator AtoC
VVARAIHAHSKRKDGSFVQVNCAALPGQLLESELFGYSKGAFTGATHDKPGKFEVANHGTIFLDEIDTLPMALQAKILQVLEDQRISRLGSVIERMLNVRIIAATNGNLEAKVAEGTFRSDLYYRLNVIAIVVPPLQERKEDLPLLVGHFMDKYCTELGKDRIALNGSMWEDLHKYHWPGNVRELENIIKGMVALGKPDLISTELNSTQPHCSADGGLPSSIDQITHQWDQGKIDQLVRDQGNISLKAIGKDCIAEVEKQAISEALKLTRWNRKKAAQLLQVGYKTLLKKIERYKIA